MEGANMVLDQLCSQVFWPIPTVVLEGLPVWKSQDGTMCWLFVQNPRDKAGWYLTTTPVLDLAQLAEELLLATLKIYSPELIGRCHFHFGFIRFHHEPQLAVNMSHSGFKSSCHCDVICMSPSGFKAMLEFDLDNSVGYTSVAQVKPDQCMIYKLAMYSGSDLGVVSRFK